MPPEEPAPASQGTSTVFEFHARATYDRRTEVNNEMQIAAAPTKPSARNWSGVVPKFTDTSQFLRHMVGNSGAACIQQLPFNGGARHDYGLAFRHSFDRYIWTYR